LGSKKALRKIRHQKKPVFRVSKKVTLNCRVHKKTRITTLRRKKITLNIIPKLDMGKAVHVKKTNNARETGEKNKSKY